jgi:hypothetical protein
MTDLTYYKDGLFVKFQPVSENGMNAYVEMVMQFGCASFLANHLYSVKSQLQNSGYVVKRKLKPSGKIVFTKEDDELLAELGVA